jgi:hypothetical protein
MQHVGLGEDAFLVARPAYPKNSATYHLLDRLLQTTIPAFRFVLVSVAVCVVFIFCPYWRWQLLRGRPVVGISAALLYLGLTLASYYLLVSSVEFALPRYAEAFEGITLTIDLIAVSGRPHQIRSRRSRLRLRRAECPGACSGCQAAT